MKTDMVQILAALQMTQKEINFDDFLFKLNTGRLLNDGKICALLNLSLSDLLREIKYYCLYHRKMIENSGLKELQDRNYINRNARMIAKQIAGLIDNNVWDLN